jgi:LysR family transcriptional regulator, regulator for metE and metH
MDLEIRHLRLVQTVAAVGSLTAAALRLNLTQSALSHQLRDIEERLGTPLFLRRNRRMMATPAGQRLIATATAVLTELERTEMEVRDMAQDRHGLLRVATECYTCYHWLPSVLQEFHRTSPAVDVRIEVDATTKPMAALLDGTLDLAIMTSTARDRRLATTTLFRDEMLAIVPAGHRLARKPFVRPADLAGETLFMYVTPDESYVYENLLHPAGVQPVWKQVRLTEAILELVRAGMGVTIQARWVVQPYLQSHALVGVRVGPRGFLRAWTAVVPRALATTDYVIEFLRLVGAHAPVARTDVTSKPVLRPVRAAG